MSTEIDYNDEAKTLFLACYIDGGPVSLPKLSVVDDIIPISDKQGDVKEYSSTEFSAALSAHIPNQWESITRYCGWLVPPEVPAGQAGFITCTTKVARLLKNLDLPLFIKPEPVAKHGPAPPLESSIQNLFPNFLEEISDDNN